MPLFRTGPRPCPGPDPEVSGPTRFVMPAGAVDSHAHVIGAPPLHPLVAGRGYDPPPAPAAHYLAMLDRAGFDRGVLVQVSVHGTDNRLLIETLTANRSRLRGVAVAPPDLPDRAYRTLAEAGVTGLRLNILFGGGIGFEALERYGALCRELGWHLQFLLDGPALEALAPRLRRLPVPIVIDHMANVPAATAASDTGFLALVDLVRDGAWVKLSAAFRLAPGPCWAATVPMARVLIEAAPERCLFGTDWPHVAWRRPMPRIGALLDLLADWAPDAAIRRRILVDNPARLYGFPPIAGLPPDRRPASG